MIVEWVRSRYRRTRASFEGGGLIAALVGVFSPATSTGEVAFTVRVESDLFDLSDDVLSPGGLQIFSGITGNKPDDRVAGTGTFQWTMDNSDTNRAGVMGYYSPAHASKLTGWSFGIPVRVIFTHLGIDYPQFTGKIREIIPDAGAYGTRRTRVTAYDVIRDLAEADVREVALQVNQSEDALLDAVLDAIPVENQPVSRDFDTGVDNFPIAFDDLGPGVKALELARDVVVSAIGMLFAKGDGTLRYLTRHAIATGASQYTFDNDMQGLVVPSNMADVFNRFRATNHPKVLSAAATEELYTLPGGNTIALAPGEVREVWVEYNDPNDRQSRVGGLDVVTSLIGGTHYSANSSDDGSGNDLTAVVTIVIEPFAASAKFTLTAAPTESTYFRVLKVIGKAVRDPGPQTFESVSTGMADRPFDLDLPYQDDPHVAQSAADYLRSLYEALEHQVASITFLASESDARMVQALAREPGDKITISEEVTGLASVVAMIQSKRLEVDENDLLWCTWGLAPANTINFWQWGIVGFSEWGISTRYAF